MKTKSKWMISIRWLIFLLLASKQVFAAGLLTPKDSGLPELEIRDHVVKVIVEDAYAITTVDQTFFNPHAQDLEAIYSFPVPKKAAVSEFTMWIDGKPIHGEVLEKKKAREVYEDQKSKNKNAGLTEKNEYKTFEMNVYPVLAGQETKVRLSYIQPAHVDTNMGTYLYPLEEGGVDEVALAFWTTNKKVTGKFTFDMVVRPAYPVDSIRLPNHPGAQITQKGKEWHVHLDNVSAATGSSADDQALTINNTNALKAQNDDVPQQGTKSVIDNSFRLDKDIVVYYRYAENLPGSVDLIAYKEESSKQGTFMMTITPGMDLQPIQAGRDWVFVLDISGSMEGKYATLAEGISRALKQMNPLDRFRIMTFNDRADELTKGFVIASPENVQEYVDTVSNIRPSGSTNLYDGLKLGLRGLDADRTTSIMLVTDGVANVGTTEQKKFVELLKQYDVRLFTFIMGNSANELLLGTLTRVSDGFAINVSNSDDIIGKILLAQGKVNFQAFHGANLKISGLKVADITPEKIGTLYRGQQLVVFGHYFGSGPASVTLSGKITGGEKTYQTKFDFPDVSTLNPEIERLWAYSRIEHLTQEMEDFGEKADIKQAVTDLGVEYGLVTDYTSMIVLEDKVFQELGIERQNQKRLEKEFSSRELRAKQDVRSNRVDSNQPMFTGYGPTFSGGGGAFDPISLLLFSPLLFVFFKKERKE